MHFIQNSWFTHNWIFLLLFLIGTFSIIAYINNRKKLLRYSSASFLILLAFVVCFTLLPQINNSLGINNDLLPSLQVGKSSEEKISTFSKIIDFIIGIFKHKIGD